MSLFQFEQRSCCVFCVNYGDHVCYCVENFSVDCIELGDRNGLIDWISGGWFRGWGCWDGREGEKIGRISWDAETCWCSHCCQDGIPSQVIENLDSSRCAGNQSKHKICR